MQGKSRLWAASGNFLSALILIALSCHASAESTDASKSIATGNGLLSATAGMVSGFTITAKDESGVRRTSGGDEFIVELEGTRSISASVTDSLDGTYDVSYTPTKSGNYEASVKLARSGGLSGQYFENVWFFYTPVKTVINPTINLDWGEGPVTDMGQDYVSIRWQGKLKPLFPETHTFFISSDDGAKLWVDNVLMIDRWDSSCNETSATIALKPHVFYNIKLEYKEVTGNAYIRLSWQTHSTPKEIIPASQLYYESQIKQSPFSLMVYPNVAYGPRCWAAGEGLALATAGTSAQLTLQANDIYDNERGEGGDLFSVRVYPPSSIEVGIQGRPVHAVVVDETDSSYISEYTTYKSGNNTLYATLLTGGGVGATYYSDDMFSNPQKSEEGVSTVQSLSFDGTTSHSLPSEGNFSVRYVGFLGPEADDVYTFTWVSSGNGGAVRVWVDNMILINQWDSSTVTGSGTIDLRATYYYDLKVEYKFEKTSSIDPSGSLRWKYSDVAQTVIGSSSLFLGQDVMDIPSLVSVLPAGTCASKSIVTPQTLGETDSLALSTAGHQAEFTITARDLYGNLRLVGGERFKVRLTGVDSLAGVVEDLQTDPGSYRVIFTATKSGTYDVSVVFGASGVHNSPYRLSVQPARRHLINSPTTGLALTLSSAGILSSITITVRDRHDNWQPDPSVAIAGIKILASDSINSTDFVSTNQQTLQSGDKPAFADQLSYIGDISLRGTQIATPTTLDNPRLILRYIITRSGRYSLLVGGSATSHESSVLGSPFSLAIHPAPACAVTSSVMGSALSIATAGIQGTYTIQARDMYGNERNWEYGDNFVAVVRQYYGYENGTDAVLHQYRNIECSTLSPPGFVCDSWMTYNSDWTTVGGRDKHPVVVDQADGTYTVSYTATRSGNNYIWTSLAVAGGLQATYYMGSTNNVSDSILFGLTGTSRVVQSDTTIDFSVTDVAPTPIAGQTTWAARWTGMVLPSVSEVYTFYFGGNVSSTDKMERVKLWVDNSLIIQQWSSLASTTAPSGSIALEKGVYYEIQCAAKTATASSSATSKFQLKWSSFSHEESVISSSRLFFSHHVGSSPLQVYVEQNMTCASKSRVYKSGLSIATAGVTASFTVQSRDAFDNKRLFNFSDNQRQFEWAILANATLPNSSLISQNSDYDGGSVVSLGTVQYVRNGGYQVNYTLTDSENYHLRGRILSPGGLYGKYYENEDLTDHAVAPDGTLSHVRAFERLDPIIDFTWGLGRPVGSVTDLGKVMSKGVLVSGDLSDPFDQVTLDPNSAVANAKYYVGARIIIGNEDREIVEFSPSGKHGFAGDNSSETYVQLNLTSTASETDHYYDGWTIFVYDNLTNSYESRMIMNFDSRYQTALLDLPLTSTPVGKSIFVSGDRVVRVEPPFISPIAAGSNYTVVDISDSKDIGPDYFSARWQGMIEPKYSEVFTFSVYCDDGAKLYVNDLLILDHWYSRISEVDGTIALMADTKYPIRLEYKQVSGNASVQMRWSSKTQMKEIVPSSSLFTWTTTSTLSNSDQPLYVEPAKVCSTQSSAFGQGLSLATAGQTAYFTLQSRDEYENNRKVADSGVRPGNPGTARLVNFGTMEYISASVVKLDNSSSGVGQAYKNYILYIDSTNEWRQIINYTTSRIATLDSPLSTTMNTQYKVLDLISLDLTGRAAFDNGYPEFHIRVLPVVDGGEEVLHSIPDRLASLQYAGGLTATYYDGWSSSPSVDADRLLSGDTFSTPRWSTWCSAGQPCDYTIDFSKSSNFKKYVYGDGCGVKWTNKVLEGTTVSDGDAHAAYLNPQTASAGKNAYLDHYILFLDGLCERRWTKIVSYEQNSFVAGLNVSDNDLWSDGLRSCIHGNNSAYEIYQDAIDESQRSQPLFPRMCEGGSDLTRGWMAFEPNENYRASLIHSDYAVRWSGYLSPTVAGVYTFYADLPSASATGESDDRVKLWIDNEVVIMQWTSLSSVNGARSGTFMLNSYPSIHTISVHYKNNVADSGLQLRWQTQEAGHKSAFTQGISGKLPADTVCSSPYYTRLGSVSAGDGFASSTVDGLYNKYYIKFETSGACNNRWTQVSNDNAVSASEVYDKSTSCIYVGETWSDGGVNCSFASGDQFKLVEWLSLPGIVTSSCSPDAHDGFTYLIADVELAATLVSLTPSEVTRLNIVAPNIIRIDDEYMLVTAVSSGTLTVTRAVSWSVLARHREGVKVYTLANFGMNTPIPLPATTFQDMVVLFTTGSCKGRYGKIVKWNNDTSCAAIGGSFLDQGNNWLDGGATCSVMVGDSYLVKFGINSSTVTNATGTAGSLPISEWLSSVGTLQADDDYCKNDYNHVHLSTLASARDLEYENHYIRFTSGICNGEWAKISYYDGGNRCAKLEWESLGKSGVFSVSNAVASGKSINQLDAIISFSDNVITMLNLAAGVYIQVDFEIMLIVDIIDSNRAFVSRAQGNTGALPHAELTAVSVVGMRCSYGDTYTLGITAGGPIVPSSRMFPLSGRYMVEYTPIIRGDYQVHASLAQGSGLDATFYDDQELNDVAMWRVDPVLNFSISDRDIGYDNANWANLLSDRLSFSVRWAGLLQLDDDVVDQDNQIFTFEASIAEFDERVKLWVDNSLIIDRWDTYDHLSSTVFSATIGLKRPNYYDVKMEYKQFAGSEAKAVLKWQCQIPGSSCQNKEIIPSSNLFRIREVMDSPFPPFSVMPAPTSADRCIADGAGLSSATAGIPALFNIQANDEYDNERGVGGDLFIINAVPFDTWDQMEKYEQSRASADCTECPHTIHGLVTDLGDSSYLANFTGTKRGAYKVLTSYAMSGGLFATYYTGTPTSYYSSFHRYNQTADSQADFASACVYQKWKVGFPLSSFECASPGYDRSDTGHLELGFLRDGSNTTHLLLDSSTRPSSYVGMTIAIVSGKAALTVRTIIDELSDKTVVVAALSEDPDSSSQYKIVGSKWQRNSGWIKGQSPVGIDRNSIKLPANGSWDRLDEEPYSATIVSPNDGVGSIQEYTDLNVHGGINCSQENQFRLGPETSGVDDDYNNRYIKFTSGTCKGRWNKIQSYVGPGMRLIQLGQELPDPTTVMLPASINKAENYYNFSTICVTSGTSAGECRKVVSYNGTVATVSPGFSTALNANSVIQIIGGSKCATLASTWSDGGAACVPSAGDNYKLMGDWRIVFTKGTCKGQFSLIADYEVSTDYAAGGTIHLATALSDSSQTGVPGPYGEVADDYMLSTITYNFTGCTAPDYTSEYVLVPGLKPPGSIDSLTGSFQVRWSGFIQPTSNTAYTFFAQLPDAAGNQERVKLWLDNVLVIDQWSSLNGNLPSGTILFANSQTSLYDLQFEYKRDSISDKPPRVKLTWLNTLSGLEANGENPIMASRLFTKLPVPNDATLDLVATGTDPQHCMATGSGLTTATAGQQALFSITSRDAYANLRDLDEDSYIVYLKGPNTTIFSKPSAVVASPGVYGVEFTPTQSGDYTVNVERPQAGGLAASWYNNMWMMGDPADTSISSDINYNWSTSFVTPRSNDQTKTGSDYVSIRWTGYFKPELSETYTFSSSYDDGFALYIDDEKLIDDWEGVNKESWCTMNLEANRLYEMTVEYRDAQEQAYCRLYYSSSSVMKSIIPSSRLYHSAEHIFGSPFKLYVNPAVTCGPVSLMSGLGLSYATAGLTAAFTIQARDEYSNLKTKWGDTFVVGAAATNAIAPDARGNFSTMPYSARDKHGTVGADVMKGRYGVQYEVTAASSITLYSAFVVTGGVFATYYNDVSATYYNHPYAALTSETIGKIQVDTDVTIRYSGLFRAESTFIYTFQPYQTTDYNDRVRLWIDSELIIDQWSSLASSIPSGTFSFPVENEYYQIQVLYRQSAANRPDELQFVYNSSNGVPFSQISSSRLFTASHVQGSPFTITVNPALTDFDTSILFGEGLSIATAGVTASFSIQVKDTFNNLRLEGGDNFTAQLSKSLSPIVLSASIVDNTDGTYQVSYLPKIEGQYNLGIYLGTYQKTSSVYVEPGVICAAMSVVNGLSLTIGTAGFTASFTIQAKDSFDNLRTLGVDNFIVRLDGPDTEEHNVLARYLGSSPNTNLGRFTVAYRTTKSGNFGMSIFAAADNGLNTTYYRDPELNFAVYNEIVPNVDFDVGDSTPNEYVGIVDGFSIQWQGFVKPQFSETYTFTGIVAEKDERIKVWLDDQWIIDQWSSLDTLTPSGSLWLVGELLYDFKVQYKEISGQSSAAIMWQSPSMSQAIVPSSRLFASANHLAGSPFATSVFPARTSGVLSIATGQGLSLATAGVPASFTIQAKDHLGNVKTTSDDVFVVRARFNGIHDDINKKNRIGIVTNIGPGLYSASYTATWKRNALSDNGWQIDTYSASKLGQYQDIGFSGIRKKFHDVLVSQALPGGLMATYYGMINSDFGSGPWEDYMKEPWLEPVSSKISPVVDVVGSPNAVESFCVSDAANFGVRFAGFFSPATAQRYTFRTIIGNTQTERVRLWVDNFLVINQWMSLSDPVDTSTGFAVYEGTFQFDSLNDFHDIRIDYKHVNTTSYDSTKVSLEYIFAAQVLDDCPSTVGSDACLQCVGRSCQYNGTAVLIPSARLFQSHDLNFDIFEAGGLTATYYDSYETVGALLDGGVYDVLVTGSAIYPYDTTCAATCQTPCTGSGFSCECNVTSGNVTMITIIDQGSGYSAQYPPIISCGGGTGQSFYPRISFAGGIVGGNLVPRKAVQEPVVDWSGSSFTDRPYPSSVADGRFSVRWMGFVRPSRMDEYTFYVSLPSLDPSNNNAHSSERVRLWVDNSLIVNQWVSLGAGPAYSGTATFPKPNEYYSIQVDYKITDTQNLRGITLEYENLASRLPLLYGKPAVNSTDVVTRGVIRSDRLFSTRVSSEVQRDDYQIWDTDYYDSSKIWNVDWKVPRTSQWSKTNGCPTTPGSLRYDECRGQGTRTNEILRVDVKPAEISADNCNVLGDSLTIATAGVTRTFTLTARDAYDNQRDANDDAFIARATLVDSTSQAFHGTFVHQDWETLYSLGELNNPVWDQNGKYEVTYVVTRSGTFQNVIQELDTGGRGLWGTYFVGSLLEQGKLMGSQAESTIDFAWGSNNPLNASAPYQGCWSARWVGFLNGNYSEIFTFTVVTDGGVRLKFDDMTIIDQWNSTSANEFSATVQMVQGVFYDLEVEYVTGAIGDKMLQLYWQSNSQAKDIVSNSNLRVESNVLGLPSNSGGPNGGYNTLFVHPTVVCATTSAVAGAGLTIATAGVRASFSVWSKDMYGNLRDDTNDILVARMFPDDSDTESGVTFAGTGLQATYYDALGFALPLHATATGATIGNWVASTQGYFSFSASTDPFTTSDNGWSVRWEGTIRPSYSELYAFTVNMSSTDRVKLWIDQSLIIDQWSSLSSTAPVGPYQSDGLVHSIKIDYRKLSTSPYVFALLWNATSVPQEEVSPVALYPCKYPSSLDAHGTACQVDSKIQTDTNLAQNLSYGVTTFSNFGFYRLQPVPNSSTATAFGPFSGNRRPFGYVQTRAGSHTVAIDEVGYNFDYRDGTFRSVPGLGLMATFYDTPGFGTARNSFDCGMGQSGCLTTNIDWSTAGLDGPFSLASDGSFSARWTGMVRIDQNVSDGVFALDLNANGKEERVKLWIDNSLLIDQWVSLSATSLDTRKNFYLPGEMYSIKVEYKKVLASSGTGAFLRLKWNNETVSRDNLYPAHVVSGMYKRVRVNPAVAFAPSCEVHGVGLTLATAGQEASFLIQSKDAYNNIRGIGGDLFVVRAFSDGCQSLNPGRDTLCNGYTGSRSPSSSTYAMNAACSDAAECAPYPPQVGSNGPNLLGDLVPGGSYIDEIVGISVLPDSTGRVLPVGSSTTQIMLRPGHFATADVYVGAALTISGCDAAKSDGLTITAYDANRIATLSEALPAVPDSTCVYTINATKTVAFLDSAASAVDDAYTDYNIMFTSGPCIDRWTRIVGYAGGQYDVAKVAYLEASIAPWIQGSVQTVVSASLLILNTMSPSDNDWRGMWLTINDASGNQQHHCKIIASSGYNITLGTSIPSTISSEDLVSFIIHGWEDGGRPCDASSGHVKLIPRICNTVIDQGTVQAVGYSVIAATIADQGSGYFAGDLVVNCSGGCIGWNLTGYCVNASDGVGLEIVITDGGRSYSPSSPPEVSCPSNSPTTAMVVTLSLAVREIQLASSASITAGAYVGYSVSVDGSGEKRTIEMYYGNRTAVISQSFTDSPLASRNLYTVSGCLGSQGPLYCPQCPRIIRADVVDNGDSTYSAVFTGTRKGQYTVVTSLVSAGGLTSTYYNDLDNTVSMDFGEGNPQSSRVDNILDWSSADGSLPTSLSGSKFGVRWVGFVRPSQAQQYTFSMNLFSIGKEERVKLWVDNSIIIQQWTSLASTSPSGTIGFGKGNGYYDIMALYKCTGNCSTAGYALKWLYQTSSTSSSTFSTIPSDRLFQRLDVPNAASGLRIQPAVTCASESVAFAQGLTLATAGVGSSFTIRSKDAYENVREDTSASFTVSLHGSGGTPVYAGAVIANAPSTLATYTGSFTLQNAKGYEVFVKHGNDNVKGSPFTLTVKPATTCGTTSTIRGTGLTMSSISPTKSAFTIQARDQFGNAKTTGPNQQEFIVRVVRTSGINKQGTNGLPPMYDSTAINVQGTLHAEYNTPTLDGSLSGYYQVPPTPDPANLIHYLYASWTAVGGVTATYYTYADAQSGEGGTWGSPLDMLVSGAAANKRMGKIGTNADNTSSVDASSVGLWGGEGLQATQSAFAIRWNGMYKNTNQTTYFKWDSGLPSDRVRLWIDNVLIIDQWSSLDQNSTNASYVFDSIGELYDIQLDWKRAADSPATFVNLQDSEDEVTYSDIPSSRLYVQEFISGSPYYVSVSC